MPYLPQDRRNHLADAAEPVNSGDLNYVMTLVADDYIERLGLSYRTINDVIGAFEAAKLEFYRRVAAPYEDTKIATNGDVYSPHNKEPK